MINSLTLHWHSIKEGITRSLKQLLLSSRLLFLDKEHTIDGCHFCLFPIATVHHQLRKLEGEQLEIKFLNKAHPKYKGDCNLKSTLKKRKQSKLPVADKWPRGVWDQDISPGNRD